MPPENKIAEVFPADVTLHSKGSVGKRNFLAVSNAESPAYTRAGRKVRHLFSATGPGIKRFILAGVRSLQRTQHILSGTGAGIGAARVAQLFKFPPIRFDPFALVVGRVGTSNVRPFNPLETEPSQILDKSVDEFGPGAGSIQVFVAQDESAVS